MYDYISYKSSYDDYSSYGGYDYYSNPHAAKSTNSSDLSGVFAAILGIGFLAWLIIIAATVLTIIGMWKAFKKSGHDGWEALIGGHNVFVRFQDSGIKSYWFFLLLVPIANLIIPFWLNIEYAKSFGKSAGFGVGLTLLPCVFFPILGLGNAQYIGPAYSDGNNNNNNYNSQYNNNNYNSQYNNMNNNMNNNTNNNTNYNQNNNNNSFSTQQNDNVQSNNNNMNDTNLNNDNTDNNNNNL